MVEACDPHVSGTNICHDGSLAHLSGPEQRHNFKGSFRGHVPKGDIVILYDSDSIYTTEEKAIENSGSVKCFEANLLEVNVSPKQMQMVED
ncbi:unnamed protein product [Prunus armeniaca]|uniref:Uncharacterized protein n=1 Tax=Prunus armeniaca TaxID=36596 RepID=A0A6J5TWE2_PRUAR|nr:unnamed protein product [Prunus armeniaca]